MDPFTAALTFVVGLAFGSFLNVGISRIPNGLSVVSPRSHCPRCDAPIRWQDNIPILSWLLLRGRCRDCGQPIASRYPAVELMTAALFVACYASFGLTATMVKGCLFCFLVLGLIFMDAETGLLPAEFTYPGIVLGLVFAGFAPQEADGAKFVCWWTGHAPPASPQVLSILDAIMGMLFGAGFFLVAWGAYYLVRRRDGIGFGDIALIAMVGSFLGLKLTVLVVFLSPILGTLCVLVWLMSRRHGNSARRPEKPASEDPLLMRQVPFGVFLGTSAMVALFFGSAIWQWYLGLFR